MDLFTEAAETEMNGIDLQRLIDFSNILRELEEGFRDIEDSREIIMGVLQAAAYFYQADRVYVLEMDEELQIGINTYEWCSDHIPAENVHSQRIASVYKGILHKTTKYGLPTY